MMQTFVPKRRATGASHSYWSGKDRGYQTTLIQGLSWSPYHDSNLRLGCLSLQGSDSCMYAVRVPPTDDNRIACSEEFPAHRIAAKAWHSVCTNHEEPIRIADRAVHS